MTLVVAGVGPDEARLRDLARHLGADVEFAGQVTDEQLRAYYARVESDGFPAV